MRKKLLAFCKVCGVEFVPANSVYTGIYRLNTCKNCYNKKAKEYQNNPENITRIKEYKKQYRENSDNQLKIREQIYQKSYGISLEEYNRKLELQLGGCAICKQPCSTGKQLAVDHNHRTGKVRDLLCYRCNGVLGLIQEDEDILIEMIEYLKRHEGGEREKIHANRSSNS